MARKAIYKHATQVNAVSYPDDGTSPVGTTEWNEDPAPQGMLGNTPTTATITIASGVATVTDSITVVTSESSTSDTLQKLALTNTNEYDLIYLFANTGHTITLEHGDLNADGEISTISGANETLSVTAPTILIRKGNYWYGYGGGAVVTPTDITVADESSDTTCFPLYVTAATGDLAPKSGSNLAFNSSSGVLTATGFAGALTGNVTGDASGSSGSCTGNAATASTATTVSDNAITLAKMAGGTDGELITYDASGDPAAVAVGTATHVLTSNGAGAAPTFQAAAGGGATIVHAFSNTTTTGYLGTASSFGTVGAGDRDIYIKKIDTNNEGIFTKIWKNGVAVEVQLA